MTTPVNPTIKDVSPEGDGSCMLVQWAAVANTNTCSPVSLPKHNDRSIQVEGTFGGATVTLGGSNDGTNYESLSSPANTAISLTATGIKAVLENALFHAPLISGGGGTQALTITMLFHMANPARQ